MVGIRVAANRRSAEAIPDAGHAVADLGTGFGAGTMRADIIAGMREATMLIRLPRWPNWETWRRSWPRITPAP
jgi:hypothetical protein